MIQYAFSLGLLVLVSVTGAQAQTFRTFPANDLPAASQALAGSDQNWPILTRVAQYEARTNTFSLSDEGFAKLAAFRQTWDAIQSDRVKYISLVRNGATVFAYDRLSEADSLWNRFRTDINAGDPDAAILTARSYAQAIIYIENDIRSYRISDVEARLVEASGTVQRRQGLIGSWLNVLTGALFKNADGIRTGERSAAKLNFVDGSDILLIENSTAIIRHASIDRLTNSTDVEITINDGGLLARLSGAAIQGSNYVVNAGTASMQVRSTNFYTEIREDETVLVANYAGSSVITSEDVSVDLAENQGTVVVRGRQPSPPIELLPAPRLPWVRADSVIIEDALNLRWASVSNAVNYEIELASNASFDRDHVIYRTGTINFNVDNIGVGTTFLRLRGIDRQGIRGNSSLTYRILRTQDIIPPAIILDNGNPQQIYTGLDRIEIAGFTEPGSRLTIQNETTTVGPDGRFAATVDLQDELNPVNLVATDRAGNTTNDTRTVIRMTEDRLFAIRWSVPTTFNTVTRAAQVSLEGTAYAPLQVIVNVSGESYSARAGTNGRWALDFPLRETDTEILISFTDRNNRTLFTRTYKLE